MTDASETAAPLRAGWRGKFAGFALALSLFGVAWFALAAIGTKLGWWNWQFGLGQMMGNVAAGYGRFVIGAALVTSILALIISLVKAPRKHAFMLSALALLIAGFLGGRWMGFQLNALRLPPLHDIQTDWDDPIMPSADLVAARVAGGALNPVEQNPVIPEAVEARWPGTGGRRVAEVQEEAEYVPGEQKSPKQTPYPRIAPLTMPATYVQGFQAARAAVETRGWTIVLEDAEAGIIEATETSFWFGFQDDIMIRVRPDGEGVRIDVRSTSRVGLSDLGANAKRVRDLLDEIEVRITKASMAG